MKLRMEKFQKEIKEGECAAAEAAWSDSNSDAESLLGFSSVSKAEEREARAATTVVEPVGKKKETLSLTMGQKPRIRTKWSRTQEVWRTQGLRPHRHLLTHTFCWNMTMNGKKR